MRAMNSTVRVRSRVPLGIDAVRGHPGVLESVVYHPGEGEACVNASLWIPLRR